MTSIEPIQIPVTGNEYAGDQADSRQALAQFYRALNSRDLRLMEQNWDNSHEAAMDNPLGGIKRGWNEIRTIYERLFASDGSYHFEFHDYTLHQRGDLFYAVGRERGELVSDGKQLRLAIRTTRIFRKDGEGKWRQVHHHGSIDDSKMLAAYQQAVLGNPVLSS
jgi:ketosteroid isomerase-like protein